jgi:hypothetical protein
MGDDCFFLWGKGMPLPHYKKKRTGHALTPQKKTANQLILYNILKTQYQKAITMANPMMMPITPTVLINLTE